MDQINQNQIVQSTYHIDFYSLAAGEEKITNIKKKLNEELTNLSLTLEKTSTYKDTVGNDRQTDKQKDSDKR